MIKLIDLNSDENPLIGRAGEEQGIRLSNEIASEDIKLPLQTNTYIFTIRSNQSTFTSLVNGRTQPISETIRISKESLIGGSAKIEIQKDGYVTNEHYLVELVDDGTPIIKNPKIQKEIPLGLSTKSVTLKKFVNNEQIDEGISLDFKTSETLNFELAEIGRDINQSDTSQQIRYNVDFIVGGMGSSVSILKNNNKRAEFFPPNGSSRYQDVDGTKYTISSSDLSLYRITSILWSDTNNNFQKEYKSNNGESVEIDVTLKDNYVFKIQTEEVNVGTPALNPKIELVKGGARTYNINSEAGVPLMFRKNKDVKAITIIVGDDIIEFDDLDKGDLCGITIPHDVFEKIGKYNVKIFPFSLENYEDEVRPAQKGEIIEPKKVTAKYDVKEIVKEDLPKITEKFNSYSPLPTGGRISTSPTPSGGRVSNSSMVRDDSIIDTNTSNRVVRDSVRNIRGL